MERLDKIQTDMMVDWSMLTEAVRAFGIDQTGIDQTSANRTLRKCHKITVKIRSCQAKNQPCLLSFGTRSQPVLPFR